MPVQPGQRDLPKAPVTPARSSPGPNGLNLGGNMTHGDDDLTPSSPIRPLRKRAASPASNEGNKRARRRNADAATEMAGALERVAKSLVVVGSPEVREKAIHLMEEDNDFSQNEAVKVMRIIAKDTAVAQTYIASSKQERRTAFLRSLLDDEEF
ncbi:hypothetical protein C8R44DRAFT_910487 [Mycena epipterygia]|nr:hypothetical protein C8R44DRAFT_910487 [Mycena epipterygia]